MNVGIFAASSVVPPVEFEIGVEFMRAQGFDVTVHPSVLHQHYTYSGTDRERADSFFELAADPRIEVLWAARGGYGAARILPLLDELTRARGKPAIQKLLVGYSDVTPLHEYVRTRWGWSTLHASMPAGSSFVALKPDELAATMDCVRHQRAEFPWEKLKLNWLTAAPASPVTAELVGGNLALWASTTGSPYWQTGAGKILFFEDIGEALYRLDRMVTQLRLAGAFDGCHAVVLGDFTDCKDESNTRRAARDSSDRVPLRQTYSLEQGLLEIFGGLGVPVATGLPVGHGDNYSPLPLGARYQLGVDGALKLVSWNWLR